MEPFTVHALHYGTLRTPSSAWGSKAAFEHVLTLAPARFLNPQAYIDES